VLDGIATSIGSISDAYDNAPAGAWTLQSCEARSRDGSNVTYPLGVDAKGTIMYTPTAKWP
jgi:hypothetical protein